LTNGAILSGLNQVAATDAEGIVNTYNADLAHAIQRIRAETPRANRATYARRVQDWAEARSAWKAGQIAITTDTKGRAMALQDFAAQNGTGGGRAKLLPTKAVCPVCQGWIARGWVPLSVATNNPGPWHPNCPHYWVVAYEGGIDCEDMWLGE
jgi:hypothetical protein